MSGRRSSLVLGVVLTLGLVMAQREFVANAGALWRDEVTGANVVTAPSFAEALGKHQLDSFPALWTAVFFGWTRIAGVADAALRPLGLAVGIALLAALWWCGRMLGTGPPLVALLLYAMSPSAIIYGGSVRGYGFGAVCLAVCMAAMWAFVDRPTRRTWIVAAVAAIAAVLTYFPNAFLVLAVCCGAGAVAVRRRAWSLLAAVLGAGAVAAVSLVPNLGWVAHAFEVGVLEQGEWSLGWLLDTFAHALAPGVPALAVAWIGCALLAWIGCVLVLVRSREAAPADVERALFALVAATVALVTYFAYLRLVARLPTQYWYYLSLMVLLALACEMGTDLLARRLPAGATLRGAVVALVALLAARDVAATVRLRMTNLDVIAAAVRDGVRPGDLVVVFPWYCGITFARYYRGAAPWMTLPDLGEHRFHSHFLVKERMAEGDGGVATELARVERTLRDGGRVWIAGPLRAPEDGEIVPSLPPAPGGPQGWRAAPYLDNWELRLGALVRAHARDVWQVELPDVGRVSVWENLPLVVAEGWR